jgi:hypothetical protein
MVICLAVVAQHLLRMSQYLRSYGLDCREVRGLDSR